MRIDHSSFVDDGRGSRPVVAIDRDPGGNMTLRTGARSALAIAAVVSVSVLAVTWSSSSASGAQRAAFGWGNNATGELAVGTTAEHHSPVAMIGLGGVTTMSTGTVHGLALEG